MGRSLFRYGVDLFSLCIDASAVMALRSAKIAAGGPSGAKEARLMVSEKLAAVTELQKALLSGKLGKDPRRICDNVLSHVHRKVKANKRRLSRR